MRFLPILIIFLAACAPDKLTPSQQEFEHICTANNDPFMLMSEIKDGQVVGPSCYGCMPDERNHVCSLDEYKRFS